MMSLLKAVLPFLGLLAVAALLAGGAVMLFRGGETLSAPPQAGPEGEVARSVPPIDAATPARVETATFALG